MNKKGEDMIKEFLYFIFRLFLLIIVVIIILAIFNLFVTRDIDVIKEETFIVSQRLIRSETCLAFEENDRVYQGVIDPTKFDLSRINTCLVLPSNKGFNVSLEEINGKNYGSFVTNDKSRAFISLCDVGDKAGFDCWVRKDYVLIDENGILKPGYLSLMVVESD
ncbi:MAG: hypothetical protein ABH849_04990 [Nanoarchaeota archaeon]